MRRLFCGLLLVVTFISRDAVAGVIMFEGYAPSAGTTAVTAGTPYTELGFTLAPTSGPAAVIDSTYVGNTMSGNPGSDFFAFGAGTVSMLSSTTPFKLISILAAAAEVGGPVIPVNLTVTGNLSGGGSISDVFTNVSAATLLNVSFAALNLDSVTFSTDNVTNLDDITFAFPAASAVPEPGTVAFLAFLAVGVVASSFRRRQVAASVETGNPIDA